MSTSKLTPAQKWILLAKAGGQCEFKGCKKFLYEDYLTKENFNYGQYAHIIADSPKGPRGDDELSENLAKDLSNIMLLCPMHHKLIDTNVDNYPAEKLKLMKQEHEAHVRKMLSIGDDKEATVIIYAANIGKQDCKINIGDANQTILYYDYYPADSYPIELGCRNSSLRDRNPLFWKVEEQNLREKFDQLVASQLATHRIKRMAIFALAPMPLLVLFGTLLTDKFDTTVYQLHKEPQSWNWQEDNVQPFEIKYPDDKRGKPVLVFSLSSNIRERIEKLYAGESISIWELTIPKPDNDYLRSKEQLSDFRQKVRAILEDINHHAAAGESIAIHMAMSVACAVALGMVRNEKADRGFKLYDYYNNEEKFALNIGINDYE